MNSEWEWKPTYNLPYQEIIHAIFQSLDLIDLANNLGYITSILNNPNIKYPYKSAEHITQGLGKAFEYALYHFNTFECSDNDVIEQCITLYQKITQKDFNAGMDLRSSGNLYYSNDNYGCQLKIINNKDIDMVNSAMMLYKDILNHSLNTEIFNQETLNNIANLQWKSEFIRFFIMYLMPFEEMKYNYLIAFILENIFKIQHEQLPTLYGVEFSAGLSGYFDRANEFFNRYIFPMVNSYHNYYFVNVNKKIGG